MIKLDKEEKALIKSIENGDWKSVPNVEKEKLRYQAYAKASLRKDQRVNIRISQNDLTMLKMKAVEEGLPYQTLMSSVLHKYAMGRI